MTAQRLDGVVAAAAIKEELRGRVAALRERGVVPGLGTLLVGDDGASQSYVRLKHRYSEEIGVASIRVDLPSDATEAEVHRAIERLNADPAVTGYLVQLPLPRGMDQHAAVVAVDPAKDVDGLHPENLGELVLGVEGELRTPLPCTPAGIVELLRRHEVPLAEREVVVLGRGLTVGRPLGLILTRKGIDATVTLAHSRTADLPSVVRRADVVVAAVGVPHLVQPDWVRPGAAVLDVGVTRIGTTGSGKAKLAGDIAPGVDEVAGWLSPNPGGVGPMTVAMLLTNVVAAAERAAAEPAA